MTLLANPTLPAEGDEGRGSLGHFSSYKLSLSNKVVIKATKIFKEAFMAQSITRHTRKRNKPFLFLNVSTNDLTLFKSICT